jgi:hypothetical protein
MADYLPCAEDDFEEFGQVYTKRLTDWFRTLLSEQVIYRYPDWGILYYNGSLRVTCKDCVHNYLVVFSCKRGHSCPSCYQKKVMEFGEWFREEILKAVPSRHLVFGVSKNLRRCFLYARKLLSELSRCA